MSVNTSSSNSNSLKSYFTSEKLPLVFKIPKTYGAILPYYQFIKSQAKYTSNQTLNRTESMASLCFRSLSTFILEDNVEGLAQFLEHKQIQIDDRDENGSTALMFACGHNASIGIISLLISHGADVNLVDGDTWTPLLIAAKAGHAAAARALLAVGAHLECRDPGAWTPLMWAAYKGHYDTLMVLLDAGADVNAHGHFHISSLVWAAGRGHQRIVDELISRQAKVNVGDKYGTTALIWASRRGYTQIVASLLNAGANVDTQGMYSWTALLVATQGNHIDVVNLLLEHRPNVNALDKDGCTALTIACKEGFYEIANSLLLSGAYINIQDRMGDTNLIHAVKGAHRGIVEALLKKYADVDVCGKDKKTAIYTAVEKGNLYIVKLLLSANPDLEICTKDGDTPLLRAVRSRNADIVQLLLDKRAKVNATDKKGDTVLHIAMRARSKTIVEILLRNPKHSQLLYRPNKQGETAYNIDLNHQKQILSQIFGARRLNTNEDNENMLGYDLYSSALADMLSEPSLSMPITVGLYAKWGSGKSFLLNKLREEMKNFAKQWIDPVFHFSVLLFLVIVHIGLTIGTVIGVVLFNWIMGLISTLIVIILCYGVIGIIWLMNTRYDWDWTYGVMVNLMRKLNSLKLILQVMFCHPPTLNANDTINAQPIRFYFTDQTRVSSTTGGENTVVQMIGSLYDAIENNYGALSTRLYRAFRPKPVKNSSTSKLRRLCCVPYAAICEICYISLLIGICTLTIYLTSNTEVIPENSSNVNTLTLHIILITVSLLLGITFISNLYTWGRVLTSLIFSQRTHLRRAISKLDTIRSEGFQQALVGEVALMRAMVRCLDSLSAQQTRLVVVLDGLDSCEQDKVLLVLDAVHMLFSDVNSPFIVILAIDPHVISKAVELNTRRLFTESNIGGHDYLRNLVHLPFFLQNSGLRQVKTAQVTAQQLRKTQGPSTWSDVDDIAPNNQYGGNNVLVRSLSNRRLSTESTLMSSSEKLKPSYPQPLRKGSRKLKLSDSVASSIASNLNLVVGAHDLTKMLLTDDYFSDVNPRSMRRLLNVVYVTGRLLKAFQVEFNWYHLASWVNITEQWPYRTSWLVLFYELHEDQLDDNTSLKTLYDKVRPKIPTLKEVEPLLELDRDEKKFDIFLTFHRSSLLISDLKIFLPFTINLDPYIKKVIKEEFQNMDEDSYGAKPVPIWSGAPTEWNTQTPRSGVVQRRPQRQVRVSPAGVPPLFGSWGPQWHESPIAGFAGVNTSLFAPVTSLPAEVLETKLSQLNVAGVCQLFEKIDDLSQNALSSYTNVIKKNNINGRVLLHCDLDELKKILKMTFGDWEMFRVLIVSLREHELTHFSRQDEQRGVRFKNDAGSSNTLREPVPRERKSSNPKIDSEAKARGPTKQTLMEKQVTLEEQMICGALQTLNEEACEDVLELEVPVKDVPHTTLIPPSPETTPQQETEFVVLAGWRNGRWAPVGSGCVSEASSTCSTPRATPKLSHDMELKHKPPLRPTSLQVDKENITKIQSPTTSIEKLAKLKDKLMQTSIDKTQLPTSLDSDDESTPLVSDLSTPSISVGPVNNAFSPQSVQSSPTQQFSSPEAEHKNDLTDSTDFSPVSPLTQHHHSAGLSASFMSLEEVYVSRSGSCGSNLSRQNALDEEQV